MISLRAPFDNVIAYLRKSFLMWVCSITAFGGGRLSMTSARVVCRFACESPEIATLHLVYRP